MPVVTPPTTVHRPLRLYGRSGELAVLDTLLTRLRRGDGGALALTAPPGTGRTALLDHAVAEHRARGPVLHTVAAPAERWVPHSGVHALLCGAPYGGAAAASHGGPPEGAGDGASRDAPGPGGPDHVLRDGLAPLALLGLLRRLGAERPLLVCVDDADLWDPDSRAALVFAARRLGPGSRVAVLIGSGDEGAVAGLPALRLGPLDDGAAAALLDRLTGCGADGDRGDPVVRAELVREAAGNPRLLTGLAARLTPDHLAGRTPLPHPLPGADDVLDAHAARLGHLPAETRTLLLIVAAAHAHEAEGAGADLALVRRAAASAAASDLTPHSPGGMAGALQLAGDRVHFREPLMRRALLHRAPPHCRRAVHDLLAGLLAPGFASLVQRACAAPGPDAVLARALEAAAVDRPPAERAAALARAAALTPDEAARAARYTAAAEQTRLAGDPGRARALLARAGTRPGHPAAHHLRGLLVLGDGPAPDAHAILLDAARLLAPRDPGRARDALLGAAEAAWAAGDALGYLDALTRIPAAAGHDLAHYRDGMCAVLRGRLGEGHALLRRCLASAARSHDPETLLRAGAAGLVLGDLDAACRAGARALAAVRASGADALLPQALEHLAYAELRAGRHARARAHAREGLRAARRTGRPNAAAPLHAVLALAASVESGTRACAAHADAALAVAAPHGLVQATTLATWAQARADLAAGRPAEAAARLEPLVGPGPRRGHFATRMLAVPCYVEASVLSGRRAVRGGGADMVAEAVAEFAVWASRTTDPQVPAQLARCRALLAPAGEVAGRYGEALAHHGRAGGDFEQARTRLLFGSWLRRRRRTREAREPLRDALVGFERCGAAAWAARAGGELRAAGEAVEAPGPSGAAAPLAALTPQQQRIARCVAEGATNREVALRLSVSTRTVDHHLRNVFAALGVRSRTELAGLLRTGPEDLYGPAGLQDRDEKEAAHP
ncbi:AAA ATPase-like protein [Streptomyces sp. KhCrAH-43]|uniref:helix-turn-helix transcriptional regulator n=1 Tax=unclassified Streptomyces TaxID=2593676 RepID=UPI000366EFA2|nr:MULTISPECIES: LuxR family transcriptional regulator [unclassified Streptomyces]MYS35323.1 AAA family ATPase [Streptomyces sp. SID4920]MYX64900.1 AAA family ATPase [Streptomyces sp. SID8373]RAJ65134.1 AAA ATPase-like protein [Streptomyces sp. KhCrAH-43]